MLLNEFLKEHRKNEKQEATISQVQSTLTQQQKRFESKLAQQEQQIGALIADLQRLAADMELNKTESRASLTSNAFLTAQEILGSAGC